MLVFQQKKKSKSKAIPVTGCGGLLGCEMLRIHRLTDDGKVVSPTHRPHSTPQKQYFPASGTHFCHGLSKPQGLVQPEGLGQLKKIHSPHRVLNPWPSCL
jgi:hypothetical protein